MEKQEDIKYFIFSPFCFVGSGKVQGWKKMSLNKFTYIPLLKNNAPLKQKKVTNNNKKKSNHPNLLKK